jgi:hypothetical protein
MTSPRPVRLVTYAWGRHYLDDLLNLALPAVLAPGNLPALASAFPCEFLLLTEESLFRAARSAPAFRKLQSICEVKLVPIDDLVATTVAYGHTLTWALFRSFEDLGERATETNLLFFNADWIPADGSYQSLIEPLRRGERLIVAPSYCVSHERVAPLLRESIDPERQVLSLPPREMASIAIRFRHNTVRGKTINQNLFHMSVMDQFYSMVDDRTILCRQMPIAIVCMRPERYESAPCTFWDYGTVSELCPNVVPRVLGDTDDFLMIELRTESTYSEGLGFGRPSFDEIVARLGSFTTQDHRDYGKHTLVLHSGDLPSDFALKKREFDDYVDGILRGLPAPIPYRNHPYWATLQPFFDTMRSQFLHSRSQGETGPLTMFTLAGMGIADLERRRIDAEERFFRQAATTDAPFEPGNAREDWPGICEGFLREISNLGHMANVLESVYRNHIVDLKNEVQRTAIALENWKSAVNIPTEGYRRLAPSAATCTSVTQQQFQRSDLSALMASVQRPSIRSVATPHFVAVRPLLAILADFPRKPSSAILTIAGDAAAYADLARQLPGSHYSVSAHAAKWMSLEHLLPPGVRFDLCVVVLGPNEVTDFSSLYERIEPFMRNGGTVTMLAVNRHPRGMKFGGHRTESEIVRGIFPVRDATRAYYTGSPLNALALYAGRRLDSLQRRSPRLGGVIRVLKGAFALLAYLGEGRREVRSGGRPPKIWSSVTVCLVVSESPALLPPSR